MRILKLLLILPVIFMSLPARAADAKTGASAGDEARPENTEVQEAQSLSDRAERPKQDTQKLSPTIHVSPLPQDEGKKIRRVVPDRAHSPLLNMPPPRDMSSPRSGDTPGVR